MAKHLQPKAKAMKAKPIERKKKTGRTKLAGVPEGAVRPAALGRHIGVADARGPARRVQEHGLGHLSPQPGRVHQAQLELLVAPNDLHRRHPAVPVEVDKLVAPRRRCLMNHQKQRRVAAHTFGGLGGGGADVAGARGGRAGQPGDAPGEVELRVAATQAQRRHVVRHRRHLRRLEAPQPDARLGG
nr:unnamed protein product [Digitaria exilis]